MTDHSDFFAAFGAPDEAHDKEKTVEIAVTGTMADRMPFRGYTVAFNVHIPVCIWPLVKRKPNELSIIDFDRVPKEAFDHFMEASARIDAEMGKIVETVAREWRLPTEAELRRFGVLNEEFDELTAAMERPFANVQ